MSDSQQPELGNFLEQKRRIVREAMASSLVKRLREPKVTHHQVSRDGEPYDTVAKVHPVDPLREEAAAMIEALATPPASQQPAPEPRLREALTDEQIDAAYDALGIECPRAGEVPVTLPTFAKALRALSSLPDGAIQVLKKDYDGESIYDLSRDIGECLLSDFNPIVKDIPVNAHGFQKGTFQVRVTWVAEGGIEE